MRVLRIIDRLNVGGPAKHVVWLESGLRRRGVTSKLVAGVVAEGEGDMGYFAAQEGVTPAIIPEMSRELGGGDLSAIVKVWRELHRFRPDIVHTHKSKAGAVGRIAAWLYRWATPAALLMRPRPCRVVHTFHGHTFHGYFGPLRSGLYRWIERALARLATDRIVVVSEQQRKEIAEGFRIGRPEQFRVVPLGIEVEAVAADSRGALRREIGVAEDEVLLGIVGRLCEIKNHEMLFRAFARLRRTAAPASAKLVVIGDGELRQRLEALAREIGVAADVVFLGFRRDVLQLYPDLDVVCITSKNEGTPLTLIEAMAARRAVAATAVGGVVDILGDRRSQADGFCVWSHGVSAEGDDVDGFARALDFLIGRPGLRDEMGRAGHEFVRRALSRERLLDDIAALYGELLGAAAGEEPALRRLASAASRSTSPL